MRFADAHRVMQRDHHAERRHDKESNPPAE
jgi:hypothetical protein